MDTVTIKNIQLSQSSIDTDIPLFKFENITQIIIENLTIINNNLIKSQIISISSLNPYSLRITDLKIIDNWILPQKINDSSVLSYFYFANTSNIEFSQILFNNNSLIINKLFEIIFIDSNSSNGILNDFLFNNSIIINQTFYKEDTKNLSLFNDGSALSAPSLISILY